MSDVIEISSEGDCDYVESYQNKPNSGPAHSVSNSDSESDTPITSHRNSSPVLSPRISSPETSFQNSSPIYKLNKQNYKNRSNLKLTNNNKKIENGKQFKNNNSDNSSSLSDNEIDNYLSRKYTEINSFKNNSSKISNSKSASKISSKSSSNLNCKKLKSVHNISNFSESESDEFPSPSKIDVFQTSSKSIENVSNSKNPMKTNDKPCTSNTLLSTKERDIDSRTSSKTKKEKNIDPCTSPRIIKKREIDLCEGNLDFCKPADEDVLNNSFSSNKSHHSISSSDSDNTLALPSSPITKKKKQTTKVKPSKSTLEEKQKKTEERLKKKKEEAEAKEKKKKIADTLRKYKPGECLKYITIKIDISIITEPYGKDILLNLDSLEVKYEIIHQSLPYTITWSRDNDKSRDEEHILLIIWSGENFFNLISENKLILTIENLKKIFLNKKIILILFGYECYLKKIKKDNKKKSLNFNFNLNEEQIEMILIELQFNHNVNVKILDIRADVALHVSQITKSIAEMPFRLEKQKIDEKSDWHASSDSRDCVKIDRLGNGLARLWRQQICQFNNVTWDVADAIARVYKTPTCLIKAYEVCSTRREGEKLLADIQVRRGKGPSATTRPVGIELSKKIYTMFTCEDPEMHLSQV